MNTRTADRVQHDLPRLPAGRRQVADRHRPGLEAASRAPGRAALIKKISTGTGNCTTSKNGLGGIRVVRNTGQQIIGIYTGDLLGNLWKFSLNDTNPSNWKVDLGGSPLYAAGPSQPITASPAVLTLPVQGATNPAPGYMVVTGTGKFYDVSDITTTPSSSCTASGTRSPSVRPRFPPAPP